ncbi:MAG: glutathione binding-like protein, partial [Pseudomonadota bacterium]
PVLELEDGTIITECTAITEYIDAQSGDPELTGMSPKERATIHMMQRRAEAGLLDAAATYFHHATPGLGPEIETYQCAEWGEHQREQALKGMRYLNDVLSEQPWLAGERFTMADITAYAGLAYVDFARIDVPDDLIHLKAWRERVANRPSVVN